ncbi:MAG: TetR/AcrR family transcriptional regulator [Rubrivivax sp.]|nr:TetR/AcrR family transcriptional regulator [Rubrivivax sp.]
MARPRSAGYEDQLELILAASARLFATRGYTATTMNEVAAACGVSKATLYHYVRDKQGLLARIATGHVTRLEALVADVVACRLPPEAQLRELIRRFMQAYASAEHQHRVLTEDVKFLGDTDRERVLEGQRRVVTAFADAVAALRPDLGAACLHKPLAMLLFGMINWTFTWLHPGGALTHETLAPVVVDLFFGGLPAVVAPAPR